jgi:hypothetical protein
MQLHAMAGLEGHCIPIDEFPMPMRAIATQQEEIPPSHSAREHWNANKEAEIEEQATSNCKKCRVAIKNGGDWGYCTCCYEETRAQEEEEDGTD